MRQAFNFEKGKRGRTEGQVDDDVVCTKLGCDWARVIGEVSAWCTLGWFMSKVICVNPECCLTQLPVLMEEEPLLTSEGTLFAFLGQYQTLMKESVRSIAYLNSRIRSRSHMLRRKVQN
jgi:hypothetical protein